ncbi:MAG: helix-turn-helix domain-containing protein [Syntrophorhabdales bacterium]|jgi:excisionase family DNA binding protein
MEKICIVKRRKVGYDRPARAPIGYPVSQETPASPRVLSIDLTPEQIEAVRSNRGFQQLYGGEARHIVFNLHLDHGPAPRMITSKMLSEMLQVSRRTVSKLVGSGVLKSYKIGRLRRFSAEDVIDYLDRSLTPRTVTRLRVEAVPEPEGENHSLPT